jgi:alpha-N-acetylglucosaminidase
MFDAARGVIERTTPDIKKLFILELIENENGKDVYEIESAGDKIILRGNNGVSLASAYYRYLQDYCNCQLSWCGDQLELPSELPEVPEKIRQVSIRKHRHFLNYCTYNYTASWWDWERWEREIDFLAMNGINMPLTIIGLEKVWYETLIELGLSDEEARGFIASPVYVGWQWMSNLEGTGGPATISWIEKRWELGTHILDRMRTLGMDPVMHGFSGHVPRILVEKYPEARIDIKRGWCRNAFKGTAQLDPTDPFFQSVGEIYFRNMNKYLGEARYYMADPFHEGTPPVEGKDYLQEVGRAISELLHKVNPGAIWTMMDWSMREDIVKALDKNNIFIMGLTKGEKKWHDWGYDFTTGIVENFGGRTHMHGDLTYLASDAYKSISEKSPHCVGTGAWMEGIELNPVVYELALDMNWRDGAIDLKKWIHERADRRYGVRSSKAHKAWDLLLEGPYSMGGFGHSSIVAARPALAPVKSGPNRPLADGLQYDTKVLVKAWELLLAEKDTLSSNAGYQYDIVDIGRQSLSNLAQFYQRRTAIAFLEKDRAKMNEESVRFLELLEDIDRLTGTHELFLLGRWMNDAKNWGAEPEESHTYQEYAAKLITVWGSDTDTWTLHDYAWREWSGLIRLFYAKRWEMFWKEMDGILAEGGDYKDPPMESWGRQFFRANDIYKRMAEWELIWSTNPPVNLPVEATEDPVETAQKLFDKYKTDLMALPAGSPEPWSKVKESRFNME